MSSSEYYLSRKLVRGFGKMRFLINLQEASSSGGGRSLLGSVVKELKSGFGGFLGIGESYPMPFHLTRPELVLKAIRERLELQQPVLTADLAPAAQTVTIKKKDSYQAGVGPFPSLPLNVNLSIDYERMSSVEISFGEGTQLEYIPTDYLSRLYRHFDGDSRQIDPAVAVDIDDNCIVDGILLARDFTVTFESVQDFDSEFEANLEAIKALPNISAKVAIARETNRRIAARIANGPYYLVAMRSIDWDDLD